MNVSQLLAILEPLPGDATVWVDQGDGHGQYTPNQHALLGEPVESVVFRRRPDAEWDLAIHAAHAQARATEKARLRVEVEIEVRRELAAQLRAEAAAVGEEPPATRYHGLTREEHEAVKVRDGAGRLYCPTCEDPTT